MAEGNRRRSLCQVVIGFTEEANRDLIDDDASFFGDIPSSDASASDSADETIALHLTRRTYLLTATMKRTLMSMIRGNRSRPQR